MTRARSMVVFALAGVIAMAVELAAAQESAASTAITTRARDATDALEVAGPWVAFLLAIAACYFVERDRRRVIRVLETQDNAHDTELQARRAEHLDDVRRFTGEALALSGTVVTERERGAARLDRWERLLEELLVEMRRGRT